MNNFLGPFPAEICENALSSFYTSARQSSLLQRLANGRQGFHKCRSIRILLPFIDMNNFCYNRAKIMEILREDAQVSCVHFEHNSINICLCLRRTEVVERNAHLISVSSTSFL